MYQQELLDIVKSYLSKHLIYFAAIPEGNDPDDYIKEKINYALKIKPKRHDFLIEENNKPYIQRHMNVTGG